MVPTLNAYGLPAYDAELIVRVREVRDPVLTEKVRVEEVADAYPAFAAIVAEIEQSPSLTHATTPLDDPTVHTDAVELEYVMLPLPADGVADIVGGVSVRK